MKKVKLADVLWKAANKHLAPTDSNHYPWRGMFRESCCAVLETVCPNWHEDGTFYEDMSEREPALLFLQELGCEAHSQFFNDSYDWRQDDGRQVQGARYMWLLLAMHVAEDEDIEIEVDA